MGESPAQSLRRKQHDWLLSVLNIDTDDYAPAGGNVPAGGGSGEDDDALQTVPSPSWDEVLHGPGEYTPKLNMDAKVLASEDKQFEGKQGEHFKNLVADAAARVKLDPGLLAAALLAEESRDQYTQTTGRQTTKRIGADDLLEKLPDMQKRIPAAKEIRLLPARDFINEQGRRIKSGQFDAKQAVLVNAVYLKYGELQVRDVLSAHGVDFESLTPELRFAFTRLAMNPGKEPVKAQIEKFLATRDIADTAPGVLIRTGVKDQDARKPQSGATRVAGIAVHLSQKVFGNRYTASSLSLAPPQGGLK